VSLVGIWFFRDAGEARVLKEANFGLYTLCTRAIGIFTGCFGDPLDMAVMRRGAALYEIQPPRAIEIIRSAFLAARGIGNALNRDRGGHAHARLMAVFASPNFHNLAMLTALGILGDLLLRSALGISRSASDSWRHCHRRAVAHSAALRPLSFL